MKGKIILKNILKVFDGQTVIFSHNADLYVVKVIESIHDDEVIVKFNHEGQTENAVKLSDLKELYLFYNFNNFGSTINEDNAREIKILPSQWETIIERDLIGQLVNWTIVAIPTEADEKIKLINAKIQDI